MIRAEEPADLEQVRSVHRNAFPTNAEADLVDALRTNGNLLVSLVASVGYELVGHVAFSPVSLGNDSLVGAGLAPVAVHAAHQAHGIGGQLIRAGLVACRHAGIDYVVVLGEPGYYQRFGFSAAAKLGLENEYGVGDEFMAIELKPNCLSDQNGLVRYGMEFGVFS